MKAKCLLFILLVFVLVKQIQLLFEHLQRCKLQLSANEIALVVPNKVLESYHTMITEPRCSVIQIG